MSQANSFQRNDWETEFDELRNIPDEVLSVYEVYVKGDSPQDERSNISSVSGVSSGSDQSLVQELDTGDKNVIKIFGKKLDPQPSKNKIQSEENIVESVAVPQISANDSSTSRLIDKDDPRSRLHFVKYLKREGKTLKIWECGICTKEFRHQYTLMRHLPTHTDERNFKCEACGKAFRQLSTLSQHKAIHSDARPYVCDFCKKTFNRVSTLISHRKTHSENKPHKCNVCGKGFHQKGNLRNHVFTHTNERPYKCELCNKGFNQMSNLVCHKVKSHAHVEKMQYSCGICGKEFPKRFALRSHEEAKHGIKYRNPSASQSRVTQSKKNIRIVELPNDNDNDNDNNNDFLETGDSLTENDKGKKLTEGIDNILLDKIETKAMENTILMGQMPFALYKPVKGIPVLVKIIPAGLSHHMLIPASAEDLRISGKMSPSVNLDLENKSVQVKVPVVATVIQIIDDSGNSTYKVEPPSDSEPEPAQGGIQFVRATEDGRYEVMSNSEARDLMEQNSHDVTILDGAEAEAINIFNARNSSQGQIADDAIDNQIMVLDAGAPQKPMLVDDIEIHDDKDIRILDSKSFAAEMAFFGGNKLNDFIFGNKPMGFDSGISMINADDDESEASWEEWWTYDGISGPAFWGLINPQWSLCSKGRRQSPINIEPDKLLFDPHLRPVQVDKHKVAGYLHNTGQFLVFKADKDTKTRVNITGGPLAYHYQFEEIYIHYGMSNDQGSEHQVNNYAFPAEIQVFGFNAELYHNMSEAQHKSQGLVAISLMVQLGDTPNQELRIITSVFNSVQYRSQKAPVGHLSLKELMPDTDGYMTYEGSTTHPGCWETTVWVIVNKPIYMSAQELYALRRLMQGTKETPKAPLGNNRRPIQLLHHRTIRTNIDFRKAPDAKCPSMVPTTHYRANTWTDGTISRNSL